MDPYHQTILYELKLWQEKMVRQPSLINRLADGVQKKINNVIPEKVHVIITNAIRNMVKAVLFGSRYFSTRLLKDEVLPQRELLVRGKIEDYKKAAVITGAGTGAGGFLLALGEFPVLLSMKIKLLFDIAGLYGFDVKDLRERLYILYIFQISYSSPLKRKAAYEYVLNWNENSLNLPENIDDFDWRTFQQEYRDYIDLAKLLQLVPGIGAVVGAVVNNNLIEKLGETAMNAYRLRIINAKLLDQ